MTDLISRQAAIDAVHEEFDGCLVWDESGETTANEFERILDYLPTVDAIEVVRCKDCKHRYVDGENVRHNVCELNHNKVQGDDWYCADGERKE